VTDIQFNKSTLRRTTKIASQQARKKHEIRTLEEAERRKKKEERERGREEDRELTQEELLAEAVETEKLNRQSYLELVRLEETKKAPPPKRPTKKGPCVVFTSKGGQQLLSFTEPHLPEEFAPQQDISRPGSPPKCAITSLPARYRDPLTGSYYATVEAFKQLREQHAQKKGTSLTA